MYALLSKMAPAKRKGAARDDSLKKKKRVRVGADETTANKTTTDTSKQTASSLQRESQPPVIRDEEPSFPRGGASVLTPLERKQIQIQATRDVLFEQSGAGKGNDAPDELDSDVGAGSDGEETAVVTKKKSRKSRSKKRDAVEEKSRKGVRIEGLSFKVDTTLDTRQQKSAMLTWLSD